MQLGDWRCWPKSLVPFEQILAHRKQTYNVQKAWVEVRVTTAASEVMMFIPHSHMMMVEALFDIVVGTLVIM